MSPEIVYENYGLKHMPSSEIIPGQSPFEPRNKMAAQWSLDLPRIELLVVDCHATISTTCCKSRKYHLTRQEAI
jgi:hypothetical protein